MPRIWIAEAIGDPVGMGRTSGNGDIHLDYFVQSLATGGPGRHIGVFGVR